MLVYSATCSGVTGRCLFSRCWFGLFWRFSNIAFMHDTSSRSSATTCGRSLNVNSLFIILQHDPLVESCCKGTTLWIGVQATFSSLTHNATITQLSLVFGCYSWINQDFEADYDNIEHVSIMNDNWDFDNNLGKISVQKGRGTSGSHQSLVTDAASICDV